MLATSGAVQTFVRTLIFVVRYPHKVSKRRESILSNEARLNDLRHLLIADFGNSTKSRA
jgi:hypothetical protein